MVVSYGYRKGIKMRFCVDSKMLNDGIASVTKALPARSSMAVLDGILLIADEQGLLLCCSDLTLQKEYRIPASVDEEGECLIKGRLFSDVVRRLPSESAFFSMDGHTLTIRCGRTVNQLQSMEYDEFPRMSFDGKDVFEMKLPAQKTRRAIDHTAFAVALDEARPALTGVLMECQGNSLSFVATDSYQFAKNTMTLEQEIPSRRVVIPGKTMVEIGHMLEEGEDKAKLVFSTTHVKVESGSTMLVSRLIDGDYFDYQRILPKSCKTRIMVEKAVLMDSIDRAQLVAREGTGSVLFVIGSESITVKAESSIGKVEDEISAQIMGDGLSIAFNPRFLLNVLKNIEDDKIYLECNSPINPCVLRPINGEEFVYLVVPMRLF